MTATFTVLIVLLLTAQGALVLLALSLARSGQRRVLPALLMAEAALAIHVMVGAYMFARWGAPAIAARPPAPDVLRPPFPPLSGDVGLGEMALAQAAPLALPDSVRPSAFLTWQEQLRARLQQVLSPPISRGTADAPGFTDIEQVVLEDGVRRRAVLLTSSDGTALPAYLFVPSRVALPAAGVLVIPGHVDLDHESGLAQTAGLVPSYQNAAALAVARVGFVTLTLELRGFGLLGPPEFPDHRSVAHNAILAGWSYKGILLRDLEAAMGFLASQPEVDAARLGIAGTSLGAELAAMYAAFDLRVAAVALNSYTPPIGPYPPALGTRPGEQPHYCHFAPGENRLLRQEQWIHLLAPRPLLCIYGGQEFAGGLEPLFTPYALLGKPSNGELRVVPDRGHEFFALETIEFFDRHLRNGQASTAAVAVKTR